MSEAKKKMTEEEILKSLDAIIDEVIGSEETTQSGEQVAKSEESKNENKDANGGGDKIKSGSPMTEKQEVAAKAKAKKSEKDEEDQEEAEEAQTSKCSVKKSDQEEKEEMREIADEEVKDHEKRMHKKMKKSIEELSAILDEEELELIKAWREENGEVEQEETPADIAKAVAQAVGSQIEDLKKAFNEKLSEKDALIKSLSEEIKKLSSQPAHSRQSIDSLEVLEKGGSSEITLTKAQVLDTMLDLQKAGKGITSHHIAEFEATRNISNPVIRNLVMEATKKRFSN